VRRALVTGASGFIGSHAIPRLLERGFEVHAVSRRPPAVASGAAWHQVELSDPGAIARLIADVRPTHLLHLAWETTPATYYTSPENLACVRDSLSVVDAFVKAGGQRVVGAGSSAEYEISGASSLVEGVTPLRPNGFYGACKKALFEILEGYASRTRTELAWGRVFFCYGPGEHPARLVPSLIVKLAGGGPVPFQAGRGIRDYLHVSDVAEAFAVLLDSSLAGAVNIGSGEAMTLRDFVSRLAAAAGRPDAVDFGAIATPSYEPERVVAGGARLRDELGWRPRVTLADGLRATVDWWRGRTAASATLPHRVQ